MLVGDFLKKWRVNTSQTALQVEGVDKQLSEAEQALQAERAKEDGRWLKHSYVDEDNKMHPSHIAMEEDGRGMDVKHEVFWSVCSLFLADALHFNFLV